jgi:hypothetical protein
VRVHLDGMGLVGSFLAQELARASIPFTWSDFDITLRSARAEGAVHSPMCSAWKASTGCIYPTDDPEERAGFEAWQFWQHLPWAKPYVEEADWWFNTKSAPHHKRKVAVVEGPAPLRRLAGTRSMHWNSQRFVNDTRARFAEFLIIQGGLRTPHTVVSHGFGPRLDHVVWGWSALASLVPGRADAEPLFNGERRPAFYGREGRFVWGYAYPCPGTPYWYVGSSMISQARPAFADQPRHLEVTPKFTKWCTTFRRLMGGAVAIRSAYNIEEGWRPYPAASDSAYVVRRDDGALHVRPMGASGVRLAPLLVRAVFKELGLL